MIRGASGGKWIRLTCNCRETPASRTTTRPFAVFFSVWLQTKVGILIIGHMTVLHLSKWWPLNWGLPLKTQYHIASMLEGFQEGPIPGHPDIESLSDSCTPDRCRNPWRGTNEPNLSPSGFFCRQFIKKRKKKFRQSLPKKKYRNVIVSEKMELGRNFFFIVLKSLLWIIIIIYYLQRCLKGMVQNPHTQRKLFGILMN